MQSRDIGRARQTLKDVETTLAESRHALDLVTGRYERGLTEFLNVVDAERQLYTKEDERIVAQEAVALQFVLLYKALSGGWSGDVSQDDLKSMASCVQHRV
jgi:outer membrane protein TolC